MNEWMLLSLANRHLQGFPGAGDSHTALDYTLARTTNVKAKGNPIVKISSREKTRQLENIHSLSH